jgi:Ni/Co efflux regulator RcnB
MKHLPKIAASLLLLGLAAAPAMAGDHDHGRGHRDGGYGRDYRHHDRDRDHDRYRDRYAPRRVVHVYAPPPRVVYRPVPRPHWERGVRYYHAGYAPTYVVTDWRPYGLRTPPRGYAWRRSDTGDFLLVALATGIIADIVLNH